MTARLHPSPVERRAVLESGSWLTDLLLLVILLCLATGVGLGVAG